MPDLITDIFTGDPFSAATLTDEVNLVETLPRELHEAGLFHPDPVHTRTIGFNCNEGVIRFAAVDRPGDPVQGSIRGKGKLRYFETVRVAEKDRIRATELEFLKGLGSKDKMEVALASLILKRQTDPEGLMATILNTMERMYLGALSGVWLDDKGEILVDWFVEFGLAPPPTIKLDILNSKEGDLVEKIDDHVIRRMKRAAKGMPFSGVGAKCGKQVITDLKKNAEYRETLKLAGRVEDLHSSNVNRPIVFAGVEWSEYFGDDEGEVALEPDEIRFYPLGGQGMFREYRSPAEGFADLGTLGREWYSYVEMDPSTNPAWVDLFMARYPGVFVSRPQMLVHGRSGA